MTDALWRAWRIAGTGFSFVVFGIGGLVIGSLVMPSLYLFIHTPLTRRRVARALIQRGFAAFVGMMKSLGLLTYEIRGRERLQRDGLLILANHPTLIDVVFLVSLLPNADCIVKSALARNPFTRGPVKAAGYIFNDDATGLVEDCIGAVRAGGTLVIFPEGTRSPRTGPAVLQRGAANIAVRGRIDVTPVRLCCSPPTLGKGEKWYKVPSRRFHFVVDVLPDLAIAPFLEGAQSGGHGEAVAARRLTRHLAEIFNGGELRARA